jgi:hypothetical protein
MGSWDRARDRTHKGKALHGQRLLGRLGARAQGFSLGLAVHQKMQQGLGLGFLWSALCVRGWRMLQCVVCVSCCLAAAPVCLRRVVVLFVVLCMCVCLLVRNESLGILAAPCSGCCWVFVCGGPVVGQAGISTDPVDITSMPGTRLVCWLCQQQSLSCYTCTHVTHLRAECITHHDPGRWAAEHSPRTFLNGCSWGTRGLLCPARRCYPPPGV